MCIVQIKVVVPNVTVSMIIGKGGCYIKQIKDDTGAYVQISQKSPDTVLIERVITIGGWLQFFHVCAVCLLNALLICDSIFHMLQSC